MCDERRVAKARALISPLSLPFIRTRSFSFTSVSAVEARCLLLKCGDGLPFLPHFTNRAPAPMAFLLPCQCEFYRCGIMDVREAVSTHRLLLRHRNSLFCSWIFGSERFLSLSPYVCRQISFVEGSKFSLCFSNFNCIRRTPIISRKRGTPCNTSEACKIVWTIEADLEAGQLLYITGDPIELGSWEPEMALLMCPTEHTNLWKAQVKIACGVNVKYNYFIKGEAWSSTGIIWKSVPKFSLSTPLSSKQKKKILVRDSWLRFDTKRPPGLSWGSWIDDNHLPSESEISTLTRDDNEIVQSLESHFIDSNILANEIIFEDEMYSNMEDSLSTTIMGSVSQESVVEIGQPVEEPWLIQSSLLFPHSKKDLEADLSKIDDAKQVKVTCPTIHNEQLQDTGQLSPEGGDKLALNEPVSTMILINSSICTMQRIAIFEDGNIVELLLEPVKTNVQCDSVYLGVVTKLVPHMGGAFVHIGNMRPSLMEIKQNREPFIFPPFRQKLRKEAINGSVVGTPSEFCIVRENENTSDDIETIDDIAEVESLGSHVYSMHNDFEENEIDVDFDITEVSMENMNGSIVDHGEVNADFKGFSDVKEHHLDTETGSSSLPTVKNNANVSEISHPRDRKATNETMDNDNKWVQVRKGTKIIVQVVKEGLGTKGPSLTAYPRLRSRFWVLTTRRNSIGVSKKLSGVERTRLKVIAKTLQPQGFGLTVRTVAAGHSLEELQKDLESLISTWKNIIENAKSAALAADEGVVGAVPVILHRAMGQTLSVVQDYFNDKVERMVVDSPRTYHEVTNYLQEIAPDLCDRVELYDKKTLLFDEFNVEAEINNILSKRVPLAKGGSLVIEQTEALVSIDVNGGHGMFGHGTSQEKAILEVNLAAATQIARELRLRDIGGIIVVDFIDMTDESHKRLVYEEVKKAVERDRSMVKVSELSRHGLMEITRKRVRPSVTFMISEPCTCCHSTGRVEALETSFLKIEQEICRLLAKMDEKAGPEDPGSWPKFILRVDQYMCDYLTSGKKTRLAILSSSLKVWLLLKVARGLTRGGFDVKTFTDEKANKNQHQVTIPMLQPTGGRNKAVGKKVTLFPVKKWKMSRR